MSKNRLILLKALRSMLSDRMDDVKLNTDLEEDVADFVTEMVNKKKHRQLRKLRNELDDFIHEYNQLQKESHVKSTHSA